MNTERAILERTAFETGRAAEYFSLRDLTALTGQEERRFPAVVLKELMDNAIDAAEEYTETPRVRVDVAPGENGIATITVEDNGPGIDPAVVQKILNFDTRTSTKQAYRSPTRGAQGNALKTIIGIPYALTGADTRLMVDSCGTLHEIRVGLNPAGFPQVKHVLSESDRAEGTAVSIDLPLNGLNPKAWPGEYALFNPHIELNYRDSTLCSRVYPTVALGDQWRKVLPSDPTCPHWYTPDDFLRLVYSYIAEEHKANQEHEGGPARTLKQFIAEFRGLTGRVKGQRVAKRFPGIKRLSELEGKQETIKELHQVMKEETKPMKPQSLGAVGEEHFRKYFEWLTNGDTDSFRYKAKRGMMDGVPFVVEVAFSYSDDKGLFTGINHAPSYQDPFDKCSFHYKDHDKLITGDGFNGMVLSMNNPEYTFLHCDYIAAIHLICPRLDFKDRGKTRPVIPGEIRKAAEEAIIACTRDAYKDSKRRLEDCRREQSAEEAAIRRAEREAEEARRRAEARKLDKREVVFLELENAVQQATDDFKLPASFRTVFYKLRPLAQQYHIKTRRTKRGDNVDLELDHVRNLIKEYIQEHGPKWAKLIYAEPRGYLLEPHTGERVDMGTREVADYVLPEGLYNKILYIEKKGLMQVFEAARIPERYDCAIIAGQGYAVDAVKDLLSRAEQENITVCVLTDADPAGYEIRRTLQEETRYTPGHNIKVCDFGLTIADAEAWELESEQATGKGKLPEALVERLTELERLYFLPPENRGLRDYRYRRVELNAFSSGELISYVESKFQEHGIQAKVYPGDGRVNGEARKYAREKLQDEIREALIQKYRIREETERIFDQVKEELPSLDLGAEVKEALKDNPPTRWTEVTQGLAKRQVAELVRGVKELC